MNKTATSILVSLAVMGSVIGGQAVLAQEGPLRGDRSGVAGSLAEAALPETTEGLGDLTGDIEPGAVGGPSDAFMPFAESIPTGDLLGDPVEDGIEAFPAGQSLPFGSDDGCVWGPGPCSACCEVCGGGANCLPTWYTVQEVRVLGRSLPEDRLISSEMTITGAGTTLEPALGSRSVPLDVSAGYAVTLGRYLGRDAENRDRFLEFTYWGLNDWNNSIQANGTRFTDSTSFAVPVTFGSLFTPFAPTTAVYDSSVGGFNRADTHTLQYQSDIDNFEVNLRFRPRGRPDRLVLRPDGSWRRECQPGWQWAYLVGLRVTTVDESFSLHSEGDIFYNSLSHNVSGDYTSRTQNDLIGLQVGFEAMQRQCKYSSGRSGKGRRLHQLRQHGPQCRQQRGERSLCLNPHRLPSQHQHRRCRLPRRNRVGRNLPLPPRRRLACLLRSHVHRRPGLGP